MSDPFIILFAFGVCGMLLFIVIAAFKNHSPEKRKKLEELYKKQDALKEELRKVSIDQVLALNKMYESGVITKLEYILKRDSIYRNLAAHNIDPDIIKELKPGGPKNKDQLLNKMLNISTVLHETNQMDTDEYNNNINIALDEKLKGKPQD